MKKLGKPVLYEERTLEEIEDLSKRRGIIIVPAGTTEGHGYHIPMGTDTLIAEWISAELSMITGLPVLIPTPIRCGCSPTFHFDLNGDPIFGTLAIGHGTMHSLCKDICRGLWAAGFRKIIFVQGHGQEWNFQTIAHEVATELRREKKALFIVGATYWELCAEAIRQEISQPFWHADEWETSAVMFVKPELVKLDAVEGKVRVPLIDKELIKGSVAQDNTETFAVQDVASWINIPEPGEIHNWGVGTKEGIQSATEEKGRKVLTRAVQRYLALIRDLEMFYAPEEVPGVDVRERPQEPRFKVEY